MRAAAIDRWLAETGDTRVVRVVRALVGVLLLANALRAANELRSGYFGDFFHWPMLPESLVPARAIYTALVVAQIALAALVVAGRRARLALAASAAIGAYVLLCDRLQFHHNRWALFCYALLLSLAPCDRATRAGPLWAVRLAQVQVSIVYLASGGSKLFDADWREGRVLLERFVLYGHQAIDRGVPASVAEWFSQPGVAGTLSVAAIATELLLAAGLWARRTRVFALWWGTWFHLVIEATSRVEGFTWLTLAMYALFATHDARARVLSFDPSAARGRLVARAVRALDWLARFDVRAEVPPRADHGVVVVDRDGSRSTGPRALAAIARCTPLLFPLWAPIALVAALSPPASNIARASPPAAD